MTRDDGQLMNSYSVAIKDDLPEHRIDPKALRLYEASQKLHNVAGQSAVARLLNESPQTLNNWERRGVSQAGALKAQESLGINATWILTGQGPMVLSAEPSPAYGDAGGQNFVAAPPHLGRVPLISWGDAGKLSDVTEPSLPGGADPWVSAYASRPSRRAFALTVEGDSMTAPAGPSFPEGCRIIVDPDRSPKAGDFVVAKDVTTQRATFKKLTTDGVHWYLKPLNPDPAYKTIEIDSPELRVIGVVIEWQMGGKL